MSQFFDWDPRKATANLKKHAVSFEEAATSFADPAALDMFDPEHSTGEDRFIHMGLSSESRLLITAYAEQEVGADSVIRIISSRLATRGEARTYASGGGRR